MMIINWESKIMSEPLYLHEDVDRKIDNLGDSCYNIFTFPPIFRNGVRGGFAASAL